MDENIVPFDIEKIRERINNEDFRFEPRIDGNNNLVSFELVRN